MSKKIIVAGGTGFVGSALLKQLKESGYETVLLTRNPDALGSIKPMVSKAVRWDARTGGTWAEELNGAFGVINLTGESIAAKRWTARQKNVILSSRVNAVRALVQAMKNQENGPKVFISASAVGYYGNVEEGDITETCAKGSGFLADTCGLWESEAKSAEKLGIRTVLLRIGVVLEKGGGALAKMLPPFMLFAGGPLGSGRQWFPWIHRDDAAGIILFALKTEALSGTVNTTAPVPVRMKEFCAEFGKAIHRPSWAPVPAFALKILLGEMSGLLLEGQKAVPQKLVRSGYSFRYPKVDRALKAIFSS
ncbi:MAG: TIGR01777 family protein [Candidatus Omnitrophica bacterium]|nr:TIGR01777 family protein [Candidatus Omnitrophota bacterium]